MVLCSFSFNGSKIYRGFNPAINDPVTNRASALSLVSYLTKKKHHQHGRIQTAFLIDMDTHTKRPNEHIHFLSSLFCRSIHCVVYWRQVQNTNRTMTVSTLGITVFQCPLSQTIFRDSEKHIFLLDIITVVFI